MKVSLVTVTFNSDQTLRDTIQSVLNQTYSDIEYIIIDGLSKDNTVDIIRKCEPQFQGRLKWISERDNGLYDAMNKGIRMSTGEIVGIIISEFFEIFPISKESGMSRHKTIPKTTRRKIPRRIITYSFIQIIWIHKTHISINCLSLLISKSLYNP